MLVNLFFQVAIFLYLMDNNTTYMILVTNAIGLAIEARGSKRLCATMQRN